MSWAEPRVPRHVAPRAGDRWRTACSTRLVNHRHLMVGVPNDMLMPVCMMAASRCPSPTSGLGSSSPDPKSRSPWEGHRRQIPLQNFPGVGLMRQLRQRRSLGSVPPSRATGMLLGIFGVVFALLSWLGRWSGSAGSPPLAVR